MTDFELLNAKIKESGMTIAAISEKAGMERSTFYNRLKGRGEFTASEIAGLTEALRLLKPERDKIFLSKSVN